MRQSLLRISNLSQALPQGLSISAPDKLKRNSSVAEPVRRIRREYRKPARLKDNNDQVRHIRAVHNLVHRPRSKHQRRLRPILVQTPQALKNKITRQAQIDLHAPARQYPLTKMRDISRPDS